MPDQIAIRIHSIAEDGYPDMDNPDMTGRVAFIFDGCIVSGWPLGSGFRGQYSGRWEADSDVGRVTVFEGVTHWIEFPVPVWEIERRKAVPA
jgi:hypothetical protein